MNLKEKVMTKQELLESIGKNKLNEGVKEEVIKILKVKAAVHKQVSLDDYKFIGYYAGDTLLDDIAVKFGLDNDGSHDNFWEKLGIKAKFVGTNYEGEYKFLI